MSGPERSPETAEQEAVENPPQKEEEKPAEQRLRQGWESLSSTYKGDDEAGDCGLAP